MGIGLFYALELLSLISINLLVTFLVIRNFKAPALPHPYVAAPMDTPNPKPSNSHRLSGVSTLKGRYEGNSNLNLSVNESSTGSTLSDSSLCPTTPDLISSESTSGSSGSDSLSHAIFGDSTSLNTPPVIISPPRLEQMVDGSSPSLMLQHQRTSLAERLLSLVDSNGRRPVSLVKRSALKDITNIAKTRSSAPGDDECIEDVQCLVYRSAEEFLPTFVSTPPTFNAPYSDSGLFGSSTSRFGDMFSPSTTPSFILPESLKLSNFAGSMSRVTGDIVTSLAAKYQNEYPDDDEDDDGMVMREQFEWEDEMRALESRLGFYDAKKM